MYSIGFTKRAKSDFSKLELQTQERVLSALERVRIAPYKFVEKLAGFPYYKLRVGNYRVILSINNMDLVILAITPGHRKSIYKNF